MHPGPNRRDSGERGAVAALVGLILVLFALVLATHRLCTRSLIGAHGFLHTAIVYSVLDRGVPPENPFAAGTDLPYYWVFHLLAAGLVQGFSINPLFAFEALNLLSLALFVVFVAVLGRRLLGSLRLGLLGSLLGLLAVNPFGPVILALRILGGEVDLAPDTSPTVHIHALRPALYYDDFRYCPNLIYFMNVTSRAAALALAAVVIWAGLRTGARPIRACALLLCTALLCAVNPLIGAATVAVLIGAWLLARFAGRFLGLRPVLNGWGAAALAGGLVLALPTWLGLSQAGAGASVKAASLDSIFTAAIRIALSGGPVLLLAMLGARAAHRRREFELPFLFFAGATLFGLALVVRLPVNNQHNFFNLALVFLALPAAGAPFLRARSGRPGFLAALLTVLVFLPTPSLDVFSFWRRGTVTLEPSAERVVCAFRPGRNAIYEWLHASTPPRSVVIDVAWPEDPPAPVHQNVSLVPAATRRRLFIDRPSYLLPDSEEVRARSLIAFKIYQGTPLGSKDFSRLRGLEAPVYVLSRRGAALDRVRRAFGGRLEIEFASESHVVVRPVLAGTQGPRDPGTQESRKKKG